MVLRCYLCKKSVTPMFTFPNDYRLETFLKFCNIPRHKYKWQRICYKHFTGTSFSPNMNKPTLTKIAVPTLYPKGCKPSEEILETDTPVGPSNNTSTINTQLPVNLNVGVIPQELNNTEFEILPPDEFFPCEINTTVFNVEDFINKTCRLCASELTDGGFFIFDLFVDENLATKMNFCLPFKISDEDPLPCKICLNCKANLGLVHLFLSKVLQANSVLTDKFEEHKDEIKKSLENREVQIGREVNLENDVVQRTEMNLNEELQFNEVLGLSEDLQLNKELLLNTDLHSNEELHLNQPFHTDSSPETEIIDSIYKCHLCNLQSFSTLKDLELHRRFHREETSICAFCPTCRKLSKDEKSLRDYHNEGIKGKKKKCTNFITEFLLVLQMYKCEYCDKFYEHHETLLEHKSNNHENRKFSCKCCLKTFEDFTIRDKHLHEVHKGSSNSMLAFAIFNYLCTVCHRKFFKNCEEIVNHEKECQDTDFSLKNSGTKSYEIKEKILTVPERASKTKENRMSNVNTKNARYVPYSQKKPEISVTASTSNLNVTRCNICGLAFPSVENLQIHLTVHNSPMRLGQDKNK